MSHFDDAVRFTLDNEGVLSDDANDRGGLTKYGIIAATLGEYQRKTGRLSGRSVASLTRGEAIEIYRARFWRFDSIENRQVAVKLFDYSVNTGPKQAALFAQRAVVLLGVPANIDGLYGPATASAINRAVVAHGYKKVLKAMCYYAAKFYVTLVDQNVTQIDFIDGWLKRAASRPS